MASRAPPYPGPPPLKNSPLKKSELTRKKAPCILFLHRSYFMRAECRKILQNKG